MSSDTAGSPTPTRRVPRSNFRLEWSAVTPTCRLSGASSSASACIWATWVEEADGDLMGEALTSPRLEGSPSPTRLPLEDAYRQVERRLDLAVTDLGPTQLKNTAEPIRVYSLQVGAPA
jgi:hypothetical protein